MDANNFTQKSIEAIKDMQYTAAERGNQQLEQVHLLYALASKEDGLIPSLVKQAGADADRLASLALSAVDSLPRVSGAQNDRAYVSHELDQVLSEAESEAKKMHDEYISVEHLMLALFTKGNMKVKDIFRTVSLTRDAFLTALKAVRGNRSVRSDDPEQTYDILKKYGTDLTERAREQKLIKDSAKRKKVIFTVALCAALAVVVLIV